MVVYIDIKDHDRDVPPYLLLLLLSVRGLVATLSRLPLVVSSSLDRQGACFIAEHRSLDQHNA